MPDSFNFNASLYNSDAQAGLSADAPGANTTIATLTVGKDGMYAITAYARQVGTPIPADVTNLDLRVGGGTNTKMIEGAYPITVYRKLVNGDVCLVRTGTTVTAAGTRYAAWIVAVRVA